MGRAATWGRPYGLQMQNFVNLPLPKRACAFGEGAGGPIPPEMPKFATSFKPRILTMQNNSRMLHYVFAALVFVVSFTTYTLTVQPTVPFWDCGEFTAAAVQQQVPHPPGAPLFLMVGKLFNLIPIGDEGWRVNMLSVVASALTVLLLYLITVKVIRHFFLEPLDTFGNQLLVLGSGAMAALAYTFTDTFWFNAVESEVYASSSLFVALIVWLMMIWSERADDPGNEKYLLLIAYLIGLSVGVHLLSILAIFSLVLLIYLRKYKWSVKGLVLTGLVGVAAFVIVYYFVIMRFPAFFAGTFPFFRTEAREFPISDNALMPVVGLLLIAGTAWLAWWGHRRNKGMVSLSATSILLILLGYSTYAHIMIRANSNPPMNENNPKDFSGLVSYLGREQYGEAPMWPRRYQTDPRFRKAYLEAGKWNEIATKVVTRKDGTRMRMPDYSKTKVNTAGELKYMWDYQAYHMYWRYFLWNFSGRVSDRQDAPAYIPLATSASTVEYWTHKTGFGQDWPVNLWALPLLIGLYGLIVHFKRDPRMASIFLVLFLMTGILAALQQNQQNPQPRERDYFYVASFFVWAMWIGIGTFGLLSEVRKNVALQGGVFAVLLAVLPLNMAWQEWHVHSRAGNYMAFDYAYNILQSADKDAIIFTNGDNDTFPVWYLQDVAGVRQDVRIVNLSLGQTTWYVDQLKNQTPHGTKKIPLSFSDESLRVSEEDPKALGMEFGYEQVVEVPVKPEILAQYTKDPSVINAGVMRWTFRGSRRQQDDQGRMMYFIGVQHKLVRDIIEQTKFERPVYFSTSVGSPEWADEFVGLGDFLRLEGMCLRVCPVPQRSSVGEGVSRERMEAAIMKTLDGDEYFKEPHQGLKFRNLGGGPTYYDDVHRGYVLNYRNVFYKYATYLLYDEQDTLRAGQVLKAMNQKLSLDRFPMGVAFELQMAKFAELCNDTSEARALATRALTSARVLLDKPMLIAVEPQADKDMQPGRYAAEACMVLRQWSEAKNYYNQLATTTRQPVFAYLADDVEVSRLEKSGDLKGALAAAQALQSKYPMNADQGMQQAAAELQRRITELQQKMGINQASVLPFSISE